MDEVKRAVSLLSPAHFPKPEFHELDGGAYVTWHFSREDALSMPLTKGQMLQPFASVAIGIRSAIDAAAERGYYERQAMEESNAL